MFHEPPAPGHHPHPSAKHLLHLLLHCCRADGEQAEAELQTIRTILEGHYPVSPDWFGQQLTLVQRKTDHTIRDLSYLRYLIQQIDLKSPELLLWYCAQVTISDGTVCLTEELMLERVGKALDLGPETCRSFRRLAQALREGDQVR